MSLYATHLAELMVMFQHVAEAMDSEVDGVAVVGMQFVTENVEAGCLDIILYRFSPKKISVILHAYHSFFSKRLI